jgi:hypothetical protein
MLASLAELMRYRNLGREEGMRIRKGYRPEAESADLSDTTRSEGRTQAKSRSQGDENTVISASFLRSSIGRSGDLAEKRTRTQVPAGGRGSSSPPPVRPGSVRYRFLDALDDISFNAPPFPIDLDYEMRKLY